MSVFFVAWTIFCIGFGSFLLVGFGIMWMDYGFERAKSVGFCALVLLFGLASNLVGYFDSKAVAHSKFSRLPNERTIGKELVITGNHRAVQYQIKDDEEKYFAIQSDEKESSNPLPLGRYYVAADGMHKLD